MSDALVRLCHHSISCTTCGKLYLTPVSLMMRQKKNLSTAFVLEQGVRCLDRGVFIHQTKLIDRNWLVGWGFTASPTAIWRCIYINVVHINETWLHNVKFLDRVINFGIRAVRLDADDDDKPDESIPNRKQVLQLPAFISIMTQRNFRHILVAWLRYFRRIR